jgi:hypothetical protein
VFHK